MSVEVVNAGMLSSSVEIELHTNYAVVMFFGRKSKSKNKSNSKYVTGLTSFLSKIGVVARGCANNDPYADWAMLQVEEKLFEVRTIIEELQAEADRIKATIPQEVTLGSNHSAQPVRIPVYASTPLAYQSAYLIVAFDRLVRDILMLHHVGLIGSYQKGKLTYSAAHPLRSLYSCLQYYQPSWVTREDFALNNEKARLAVEKYGLPPQAVLVGTRRSQFAPPIRKRYARYVLEKMELKDVCNTSFSWAVDPTVEQEGASEDTTSGES